MKTTVSGKVRSFVVCGMRTEVGFAPMGVGTVHCFDAGQGLTELASEAQAFPSWKVAHERACELNANPTGWFFFVWPACGMGVAQ